MLSQSTEVEGFEELHLSYTIISFYIPSIINSLSASGISSAALQQVPLCHVHQLLAWHWRMCPAFALLYLK